MKLRYYGTFTILFMAAIGWYVYHATPEKLALNVAQHTFILPVAVWVVGAVFVFFLFTLFFMLLGGIGNFFKRYAEKRDFEKLVGQIIDQNTHNSFSKQNYSNPHFAELSNILSRFFLKEDLNTAQSGHEKVDQLFELYQKVQKGEEVEWQKYHLDAHNSLYTQNIFNKIDRDLKYASFVLKKEGFSPEAKKQALINIIQRGSLKEIPKVLKGAKELVDKSVLAVLLQVFWQKNVGLSQAEVVELCVGVGYDKQEYLQMALDSKPFLSPDDWFKFFELLASKDELAEKALLFVLLDLEMLEQAKERLNTHPQDEFLIIKAYLELKKSDRSYPLALFFGLTTPVKLIKLDKTESTPPPKL
ncbi:hypothetical protein [Helicobacter suis]|uniref:hypothetical protein n=1 Tax=Helicobacter suis TaxID=104628 RepID=UPI0019675167|nr:hypothetical protein [Helicobacter suis]